VYPVFNIYFGKNEILNLTKLFKKSFFITVSISLILSIILLFAGNSIWEIWIGESVVFNQTIFNLLILIQLIGSFWIISSNLIVSINKHFILSNIYLISSIISIMLFYFCSSKFQIGFEFVPLFYLINHIPILIYSSIKVKSILK
ncbi:MAG: hypothetical protein P8O81_04260, partial [Flavobacteriaceae bacterium]|nr:hypothetical protein [Flavobacteriaceae bacterium]